MGLIGLISLIGFIGLIGLLVTAECCPYSIYDHCAAFQRVDL
jgi:hypothetical protein